MLAKTTHLFLGLITGFCRRGLCRSVFVVRGLSWEGGIVAHSCMVSTPWRGYLGLPVCTSATIRRMRSGHAAAAAAASAHPAHHQITSCIRD